MKWEPSEEQIKEIEQYLIERMAERLAKELDDDDRMKEGKDNGHISKGGKRNEDLIK